MADTNIQKVYTLSIVGGDKSITEVEKLNSAFDKLRETKQQLNGQLEQAIFSKSSTEEITNLRKQLSDLNRQMSAVGKERQKASNDAKAAAQAEKLLADIKLKEAQATAAQARADKERTAALIAQEKELDRQIDRESRLAAQMAKSQQQTQQATGYYNRLKAELDSLYKLVKGAEKTDLVQFQGNTLNYDQAIAKLKELSAAEQEFRRQFAKDQTLVGEYTTGILQAFNKAGLNDLINNQINNANTKIKDLDKSFEALTAEYAKIRAEGSGAFDAVEKEMIQNRQEAEKLRNEVAGINTRLKEVDGIGDKVTNALKNGFRDAAKQITTYAVGLVGLQRLLNVVSTEFTEGIADAKKIEGVEAAFGNLNRPGLLDNLRDSTRGTVNDLELMQRAVQANNFQIPLENLGSLLDFARRRAKDTGQEVGFLADSIVTGIGRKSPLILDNLGISAVRLKEALGGVAAESASTGEVAAAVAKIIAEENAKSGVEIETQSEKIAQQKAQWENLRTELAKGVLPIIAAIGSVLLFLLSNLTTIASILGIFTLGWALANQQMVLANARLLLVNAQLLASRIALGAVNIALALNAVAQRAYTTALLLFTGVQRGATAASILFGNALRLLPLGLILTVLGILVASFKAFAASVNNTTDDLRRFAMQQEINAEISRRVADATTDQISKLQVLSKVAGDNNISLENRKKALQDLIDQNPEYLKGLTLENLKTEEGIGILSRYIAVLREKASLEAAQAIRNEKLQKDTRLQLFQFELEKRISTGQGTGLDDLPDDLKEFVGNARKQFAFTASVTDLLTGGSAADEALAVIKAERSKLIEELDVTDEIIKQRFSNVNQTVATGDTKQVEVDIKSLQERLKSLNDQREVFQGTRKDWVELNQEIKKTESELNQLLGKNQGGGSSKGSSLSGSQRDQFKATEAEFDRQLAVEKKRVADIQKVRELTISEELEHSQKMTEIQTAFIDAKLSQLKGKNAEERKLIADLNLEKVNLELQLQKDTQAAREKEFSRQNELLKKRFESFKSNEELKLTQSEEANVGNDFTRAQAKVTFFETMLDAQKKFNKNQKLLEKTLKVNSEVNAEERGKALTEIERNLSQARIAAVRSGLQQTLKDVEDASLLALNQIKQDTADAINKILSDPNLSNRQKGLQINKLERDQTRNLLEKEIDGQQKALDAKKALFERGLLTEQQYSDAKTALKLKELELIRLVGNEELSLMEKVRNGIGETIRGMLGLKDFASEQEKVDAALQQTASIIQNTIQQAYQSWFDRQEQAIENQLQGTLATTEAEKQRALAAAQSAEEREAIEQKFEAKREAAERAAGEKKKKNALKEAAISYGVALIKTMAQYGFPLGLIPAAGLTIQYLVQRSNINAQQFAEGGQVQAVPLSDGRISTPSNISTQPNGDNVLATVRTGEVILNRAQQYALGGAKVFKAIGVPGFAGGGVVSGGSRFDNLLNGGTPPPVIDSVNGRLAFGEQANLSDLAAMVKENSAQISALNQRTDRIAQMVASTDRKPVVASEVEAKNQERKAASDYGSF